MDNFDYENYYQHNDFQPDEKPIVQPPKKKRDYRFAKAFTAFTAVIAIGAGCLGTGLSIGSEMTKAYIAQTAVEASKEILTDNESISQPSETYAQADKPEQPQSPTQEPVSDAPASISKSTAYSDLLSDSPSLVSDVYKAVSQSVVSINVKSTAVTMFNRLVESQQAGSGIIFKQDGDKIYIMTNYHVINGAKEATISLDDTVQVSANYVGGNESNDIAVISVNKSDIEKAGIKNYAVAEFDDSDKIEIGNFVIAIGNAMGEGKSATFGIISAVNKEINIENQLLSVIQTDAAINPGNSGGALVNTDGKVIGINTAKFSSMGIEGMGYAIPSNIVNQIVDEIMGQKRVEAPYLGVEARTITEQIKEVYNFPQLGVYVNSVVPGSSAEEGGLNQGDIITAINGKPIITSEELINVINSSKVGDTLKITVLRNARDEMNINCVLKSKGFNF